MSSDAFGVTKFYTKYFWNFFNKISLLLLHIFTEKTILLLQKKNHYQTTSTFNERVYDAQSLNLLHSWLHQKISNQNQSLFLRFNKPGREQFEKLNPNLRNARQTQKLMIHPRSRPS